METLLSSDFWLDQIAAALKAWAILILLFVAFYAALKIKSATANRKVRKLKAYTEAVESRLQLARDLTIGEANNLNTLRAEIDALRISKSKNPTALKRIKELDALATTLAMANGTTAHILNAEKLSIGNIENKPNLRLVPRPTE